MMMQVRARMADDQGTISSEFSIIFAALMVGFFSLMIMAGRILQQENQVRSAAEEAARAASLEPTLAEGQAAAVAVATENLSSAGVTCTDQSVTVGSPTDFVAGGQVTIRVQCTAQGLQTAIGLGDNVFAHEATEVIDVFRGEP